MDKKELDRQIQNFCNGIIVVCPICGKVDIDPEDHYQKCDPIGEAQRQKNLEYYD